MDEKNNESNSHSDDSKETFYEHKLSEFIILEEGEKEGESSHQGIHPKRAAAIPFRVRVICLIIGAFACLWFIGAVVVFLTSWVLATLTLYRNATLSPLPARYWKSVKSGAAVATGLLIAVFSPQLGLVMIFTYF